MVDSDGGRTIVTQRAGPWKSIVIACAVGGAFGAGTLVASPDPHAAARTPETLAAALERAEQKTAELAEKRGAIKLGFARELEARDAPAKLPPLPKGKKSAAAATEDAAQAPEAPPAAAAPATAPAVARADEGEDAPEPKDDALDAGTKVPDPARVQRSIAKVLGSAPVAEAAPKAAANGVFALQVASTPQRDAAEQLAQKLKGQGHAARVVTAELDGKGTVYRVRVGAFADRAQADAYKGKLAMPAFVIGE